MVNARLEGRDSRASGAEAARHPSPQELIEPRMDAGPMHQVIRLVIGPGAGAAHQEASRIAAGPAIDLGMHDLGMELHTDCSRSVEEGLVRERAA